jgi:patatin-like phospholipase/acyl hydrolase
VFREFRAYSVQVFVTTTHCDGVKRDVILVRSYPTRKGKRAKDYDHPWTIEEAALATAAAPTYFNRLIIFVNGTRFSFEDAGAHRANNPTKRAWKECQKLSDLQGESSLFLSLGTGTAPSRPTSGFFGFFKNKIDTFKAWVTYATDVHGVHRKMKRRADRSKKMYVPLKWEAIN